MDQEEGSMEEVVRVEVLKWFAGRLKMKILKCNRRETSSSNCIRVLEKQKSAATHLIPSV